MTQPVPITSRRVPAFAVYGVVGVVATAVDWAVFYVLNVAEGIHYEIAITASFVAGSCVNYVLNRLVTFRSKKSIVVSLAYFSLISGLSLLMSSALMGVLVGWLGAGRWSVLGLPGAFAARIATTLIMFVVNFQLHAHLTFSERSLKQRWAGLFRD